MKVLLASRNPGKLREVRSIMASVGIQVDEAPMDWESPEETGDTYLENALLKARSLAQHSGVPAVADDSGIEVYALDGKPGPRSARFAGEGATDAQNLQKLLERARTIPENLRGARYVCVAAMATPEGRELHTEGTFEGCIVLEPKGTGGFGYDPIFGLPNEDRTAAELTAEQKDAISHRGKAFRALAPQLSALLNT